MLKRLMCLAVPMIFVFALAACAFVANDVRTPPDVYREDETETTLALTMPTSVEKWIDFYTDSENMPWDGVYQLSISEFPGVTFTWSEGKEVTAESDRTGIRKILFTGMPIWNVFLINITGDGLPDFAATASWGSGIVDTRILVYDYANDNAYELSDRAYFNYALSMEDGNLIVTKTPYAAPPQWGQDGQKGELAIIDGHLTMIELWNVDMN